MNRLNSNTSTSSPLLGLPDATWRGLLEDAHGAGASDSHPLYSPLLGLRTDRPFVFAHLAQSLDGRIALDNGESKWISGPADLDHTHRLRALSDAVLVGARTIAADNPRLTVRRVPGPDPQRVVIDPSLRLSTDHHVFEDAGAWRICRADAPGADGLRIPGGTGDLNPSVMLAALHARGIRRLFIEGGALTISRFLQAGCLDRLHLVVSPLLLGSGRPSLQLPELIALSDAIRPTVCTYSLGQDTLFDCSFSD